MSAELITILAVAVALGGVMYSGFRGLRQDIAELRIETRQDIAELRAETRQDIAELRAETRQSIAGVKQDIGELRERMARLEGLFEGSRQADVAHG